MRFVLLTISVLIGLAVRADAETQPDSEREHASIALSRLGYGPALGDVQTVTRMGVSNYVHQQLYPEKIPESPQLLRQLAAMTTLNQSPEALFIRDRELNEQKRDAKGNDDDSGDKRGIKAQIGLPDREADEAKLLRAIESPRQLQEMLVDFWFNHFNVYQKKDIDRVWINAYDEQAIRPYVFGRFRDMLEATAKHPAMLFYLDNWKNVAPGNGQPQAGLNGRVKAKNGEEAGINENYAREVMELHTLGVDGGYTQSDVTQLARILSGWGFGAAKMNQVRNGFTDKAAMKREINAQNASVFFFNPDHHDFGQKVFLGRVFPGGVGRQEGETALDMLAYNPVTAHHISYELAQFFVADEPPKELVRRMEDTWARTGGDLREVTRTMVDSSEFWDKQYRQAKYRTPFQYVAAAVRASGAPVDTEVLLQALEKMGERPYNNLTPDGYKNTSDVWLTPSATEERLTFATALGTGKLEQIHFMNNPDGSNGHPDRQGQPVPLDPARIEAAIDAGLSPATAQAVSEVQPGLQAAALLGSPEMMRR